MIKKLRRKFIFIFMCITCLTLSAIFLAVILSAYHRLESGCRADLSRHLNTHRQQPSPPENDSNSVVFTFRFSKSGKKIDSTVSDGISILSDETIKNITDHALTSEKNYGTVPDYPFAFMKKKYSDGSIILAFYDLTADLQSMHSLCFSFLMAELLSFFLFYAVSLLLSAWCIRPIEKTWNQQQKFIADASHELKTPLTVILANTAIIKKHSDEPIRNREKCITYIEEEAQHMSRLVNDMLFLAKTDAFRESIGKSPVNFSDICLNSYLTFESVAFEKNICMDSDITENLSVNGVENNLAQLCTILLDNACKYTENNGKIHLSLKKKGNTILLKVNNSGSPIPKEQISHLFERFYRADEARTRSCGGYGLGLSIAFSIVKMHHGKITIDSSEKEGTTARVELPAL